MITETAAKEKKRKEIEYGTGKDLAADILSPVETLAWRRWIAFKAM